MLRQPTGRVFGIDLTQYRVGHTYEVTPSLATYLVLEGSARYEMRRTRDRRQKPRPTPDRRREATGMPDHYRGS
jgi:hypothetical protein